MITSGLTGVVYYVDTSQPSTSATNEAMTDSGDHLRFYVTNQAKRYWDPSQPVTVKANGVVVTNYTVEHCGGNIVFTSQPSTPVTASFYYWPYAKYGMCRKWTLKYKPATHDVTVLNDAGVRRVRGLDDYEASLEGFYEDPTWMNMSLGDKLLGVVLHESGTYTTGSTTGQRYEMYAHLDASLEMDVKDVMKTTLSLVSEGQCYYRKV